MPYGFRVEGWGVLARDTAGLARCVAWQSPDDTAGAGTASGGDRGEYAARRCEEGASGCGGPLELQVGSLLVHCSISKANSESPRPVASISVSEANKLEKGQLRRRRVAPETCRVDGMVGCMLEDRLGGKNENREAENRYGQSSRVLSSGHQARDLWIRVKLRPKICVLVPQKIVEITSLIRSRVQERSRVPRDHMLRTYVRLLLELITKGWNLFWNCF